MLTPRIVDGLHYHLPFIRVVRETKKDALDEVIRRTSHLDREEHCPRLMEFERMADGWAVTINLGAQEC